MIRSDPSRGYMKLITDRVINEISAIIETIDIHAPEIVP